MSAKSKKDRVNDNEQIEIPITWGTSDNVPTIYANQLFISHAQGNEFYIVFGELSVPMLTGAKGEKIPDALEIKPVAKIAVTPDFMLKITQAINTNVAKYLDKVNKIESGQ